MLNSNFTLRLFDAIGRHQTMMDIRRGEAGEEDGKLRTDKGELRRDYDMPIILERDMFEECQVGSSSNSYCQHSNLTYQILTDYQWSLVSGPNTGTELHLDPPFAQSWNTLVSGNKMWALLPPDTEHRLLECDPKCSGHDKVGALYLE